MSNLVVDTLLGFAKDIEMNPEDIHSLSVEDSELLLKKMLACQTRDASQFVCAMLDSEDVKRMHVETQGSIWTIGQRKPLNSAFYQYIFDNAIISSDLSSSNETFKNFKRFLGLPKNSGDKETLRLFHALNLCNMRDEVFATLPASMDNFQKNEICRLMSKYLEEDEGGNRCIVQNDIASLWEQQVHFPFFKDRRVIVGKTSTDEPPSCASAEAAIPLATLRVVADTVKTPDITHNPLLKRFRLVADVPVNYPLLDAARQFILVTTSTAPDRIKEDLEKLLHRDQSVDKMLSSDFKGALEKVPDREKHFKDIVSYVAAELPAGLHDRINACPECALYAKEKVPPPPKNTTVAASDFLGNFMYHHWQQQTNLGQRWIAEVLSASP